MAEEQRVTVRTPDTAPVKVSCAQCVRTTAHQVLAEVEVYWADDWYKAYTYYQIVQCRGCDHVSFRMAESNSEDFDVDDQGKPYHPETVRVFPSLVAGRAPLRDAHHLPYPLDKIYAETHMALATPQPILAAVGIRVLIEAISKEKGAAGKSLMEKIDALVSMGVLTSDGAASLHMLRGLGNTATHEAKAFSHEQLTTAFDVVEHLLQGVYLLPLKAATLKDAK